MDSKELLKQIVEVAKSKNISEDNVIDALQNAIRKGYIRQIKGSEEDAMVDVIIDRKKGTIDIIHRRDVLEDGYREDYLEIPLAQAKLIDKNAKVGGQIEQHIDIDKVSSLMAKAVRSALNQNTAEAEKAVLYDTYHDKIGEMITGTIERCDERSATITLGKTSVYLSRKEMIGDEMFQPGQQIRLYIADVSTTTKGPQIQVTRSDEGFLKRIFEEEIHEVYDGTVIIKGIARLAGVRSKVAVISTDENVDPLGACIGPGRSRLSKITSQLGNEKVDVVNYSENPGLFIIEAMRPATVVGINLKPETKEATVVVKDGQISLAIGHKFANIRLASKLTGWVINVKEEKELANMEIPMVFKTPDDIKKEEQEKVKLAQYNKYLKSVKEQEEHTAIVSPVEVKPVEEVKETEKVTEPVTEKVTEPVVEEKKSEPVENKAPVEEKKIEVKTTSTLESLEKELESEKKKGSASSASGKQKYQKSKRPRNISDEEVGVSAEESKNRNNSKMDIYTEEELAELEEEENKNSQKDNSNDEEDVDYDEYDKYYDDNDGK